LGAGLTEEEFLSDYRLIEDEVLDAINLFHTYLEIHKFAAEDRNIYKAINASAPFWNTQLHGLQTTFFIVLARIFDDGKGHSVHKLLATVLKHPEYFSKNALRERKRAASGEQQPAWLESYISSAWEPAKEDLRKLKNGLRPHAKKFEDLYRPIRHKIFAHQDLKDGEEIAKLMANAIIVEVDELLYFLFHLMETLRQIFYNGRPPQADGTERYESHKDRIKNTTRDVLLALAVGTNVRSLRGS
jgi:AbiU2